MSDLKFLQLAIDQSVKSYNEGAFPAGAVIVKNGKILTKTTATKYPKINFHPESKAIDRVINKLNRQLTDCILYCSMQPCLMCLSRAYWAGIRKIVAVQKEAVPANLCYESKLDHSKLLKKFNQKIEMIHITALEQKALETVNKWLKENS